MSRRHLRFFRRDGSVFVEDLETHNGTFVSAARLLAPLLIRGGFELTLGGEVRVAVATRADGGLTVEVGGVRYVLPLGAPRVGPFALVVGESVRLVGSGDTPETPILNDGVCAAEGIDLARGDVIRVTRGGDVFARVP